MIPVGLVLPLSGRQGACVGEMDSLECTGTTVVRPSGCRRKRWLPFALCAAKPALLMNANNIKLFNIPFLSSEAKLNSFNLVFARSITATCQRLSGGFREPPCRLSCFPIRANVSIANRCLAIAWPPFQYMPVHQFWRRLRLQAPPLRGLQPSGFSSPRSIASAPGCGAPGSRGSSGCRQSRGWCRSTPASSCRCGCRGAPPVWGPVP